MAKRAARGAGSIRKRTHIRNGKTYTYWEARITTGQDPVTGRQIQRTFSGKSQKEVRERMQAVAVEVNRGLYIAPSKMTLGEWLDIWTAEYLGGRKFNTVRIYKGNVERHIKPVLGEVGLADLHPHTVQAFINRLDGLAPSSVRMVHQVLNLALGRAMALGYLSGNPAAHCVLPKRAQREIVPLEDDQATALLAATRGGELEYFITAALFTGMRLSELLGLTWSSVDMERGTVTVDKQLSRFEVLEDEVFTSPKNGRSRILTPAPSVLAALRAQQRRQAGMRLAAGAAWNNLHGLVFTNPWGRYLFPQYINKHFRMLTAAAGLEGVRFHDLRHTYAVNSIRAGDDIKTIQCNLGHATAAFTLDRYGHFTERMKQESAARMEAFMKTVLEL